MPRRENYASYDPRIKSMIARTGQVELFPHLKVPRTTVLYWIEQGFEIDDPIFDSLAETIAGMRDQQKMAQAAVGQDYKRDLLPRSPQRLRPK